jgi:hypothetical protein
MKMPKSYEMTATTYLSEVIARMIGKAFRCEWHRNELPGDHWGEYLLVRDGEMKAVLRVFPDHPPELVDAPHYLDLAEANRVATTFRSLGLKLLVARRTPTGLQIATLDGVTVDRIHTWTTEGGELRAGWIIDPIEFRRTVPLEEGKTWASFQTVGGGDA